MSEETFAAARAALTSAGSVLSASRAQDLAFSLYDLAKGKDLVALQAILTRSLSQRALGPQEIAGITVLLDSIEAVSLTGVDKA